MNIIQIVGIAFVGLLISVLLKQYRKEYALVVQTATVLIITFMIVSDISKILTTLTGLASGIGMNLSYIKILTKVLGVCLVTQFVSDLCKDNNEKALSSQVELSGKIIVVSLMLPLIEVLIQLVVGIVK